MTGTIKRIAGPSYISNSAANIYTPAASTIYTVIRHLHVVNRTNAAATFSLFIGATGGSAAGTELAGTISVAAYSVWDWFGYLRMDSTDFLSGIAGTASALVIIVEGELNVV
jgi:hypothetical protein